VPAIEEVVLASDELEVVLLPGIGCRLHRLRAFGADLLRTPNDPATHRDDPFFWGGYVLAPWANRVSARPTTIAGRRVDLPANFADGTAIHGQVYAAPWRRTGDGSFAVEAGGDGWPWRYEVTLDVVIDGPRLRLAYRLVNCSEEPMPAGLGLHPWWVRPVEVALDARAVHPRNGEADAEPVPAADAWALRGSEPPSGLDATWLEVDPPAVRLRWPDVALSAAIGIASEGAAATHVAVATPADPDATAIEPVTHAPWALDRLSRGRAGDIALVEPGASIDLGIQCAFTAQPAVSRRGMAE
jgi:aldose 1-epimerase